MKLLDNTPSFSSRRSGENIFGEVEYSEPFLNEVLGITSNLILSLSKIGNGFCDFLDDSLRNKFFEGKPLSPAFRRSVGLLSGNHHVCDFASYFKFGYLTELALEENNNWCKIYDLVEFLLSCLYQAGDLQRFIENYTTYFNYNADYWNISYRLIAGRICPIVDDVQIKVVQDVEEISNNSRLLVVLDHRNRALSHFSSRISPDYRASMKESIDMVEGYLKALIGNPKATLGDCLKKISCNDTRIENFIRLGQKHYDFANNNGIRHAKDVAVSPYAKEDARFFLVECCNLVLWLEQKHLAGKLELKS